jgi:hypothetical protein
MNQDQRQFIESVSHYCDGIIVNVGCRGAKCEYADGDEDHQCESHFSWHQCESCGSTFGGERLPATFFITDKSDPKHKTVYDMEICTDCAMYHANDELPETWEQHPD